MLLLGGIQLKYKWKPLVLALAIPLTVGGLSALLTRQGMAVFRALEKPPLAPPGCCFPPSGQSCFC